MAKDMISQSFPATGHVPAFAWTRMLVICLIAMGHVSTMPLGPGTQEFGSQFGYDPSWLGVNVLFMLSGFMAMRSLMRHGSPIKLLSTRFKRNFPTLLIYAALVSLVVFPLFGINPSDNAGIVSHLALYTFNVLTCVDPGRLLPGLLDDAKYACVIQGAIWTFRWGVIAYMGAAIGWKTGLFKYAHFLYCTAALTLMAYILVHGLTVWRLLEIPAFIGTALRLSCPFLAGMCTFTLSSRLPRSLVALAGLWTVTATIYLLLPWSPLIEIMGTLSWAYAAYLLMTTKLKLPSAAASVPDLSLGLYIFHWPAAQIILLLRPESTSLSLFMIAMPCTIALSLAVHIVLSRLGRPHVKTVTTHTTLKAHKS